MFFWIENYLGTLGRHIASSTPQSRQPNGERDYKKMRRETDHDKYRKLRERPDDWSEAKEMAGVEMGRGGRGENKRATTTTHP